MAVKFNGPGYEHVKRLIEDSKFIGNNIHRCGILAAQSRASQSKYLDIGDAAADLLAVIDKQARPKAW